MIRSYRPLWNLIRAARPSGRLLAAATAMAVISVVGTLCFPILTRHIVDDLGASAADPIDIPILAAVLLGSTIASTAASYLMTTLGYRLVVSLRYSLTDKMFRLPVPAFDQESTGERVSGVISDCESISELATRQAINFITGVLLLLGSISVLFFLDVCLTPTLLGCVAAAFVVIVPVAFLLEGHFRRIQDRTAKLGGILTHVFSEIRLVKAFTAEARERARCRQESDLEIAAHDEAGAVGGGLDGVAPLGQVDLGGGLDEAGDHGAELIEQLRRHPLLHLGQVLLDQLHHVRRHREPRLDHHDRRS